MAGTFEIFRASKGEFRFTLKSRHGETVAAGESYKTKAGAIKGTDSVQRAAAGAKVEDKTN